MTVPDKDYDSVAKLFHWLILLLVLVQFGVALSMPDIHKDTKPEGLISIHLSLGATILVLMVLRLAWRLTHPVPLLTEGIPAWQVKTARATHIVLYVFLIVMPVLGWANASTRDWDVRLFGLVTLPRILPAHMPNGHAIGDIHGLAAYALMGLLVLHAAAGLYHHFKLRDRTLQRMLP